MHYGICAISSGVAGPSRVGDSRAHPEGQNEQILRKKGLSDLHRGSALTHTILQHLLVSFCTVWYKEKQPKKRLNFQFTSWKDLKFHQSVYADILVTCNLVMWYELNKK